jgi:hypothetical protein
VTSRRQQQPELTLKLLGTAIVIHLLRAMLTNLAISRTASNPPTPGSTMESPGSTRSSSSTASEPPSKRNTAQSSMR